MASKVCVVVALNALPQECVLTFSVLLQRNPEGELQHFVWHRPSHNLGYYTEIQYSHTNQEL